MEPKRLIESTQRLQALCVEHGVTVSVAESLTAGLIGATLGSVAGSSAYFEGGVIAYSPQVKQWLLGVSGEVIERFGVVSCECATAMATGVRNACGSRAGVAVTGEAGPQAGDEGVEVGTVWIAVSLDDSTVAHEFFFNGDRNAIRNQTVVEAITFLTETILNAAKDSCF